MCKLRYPKEILEIIFNQARNSYPAEACGMLSGSTERRGGSIVAIHQMANVYDRYHEADPEAYPRTSSTAYLMEPRQQNRLREALDEHGTPTLCIYHSHVDVGAYFSEEDTKMALWDGEPLFPKVEYLVVSVRDGEVDEARAFRWNGHEFEGRGVQLQGE